MNKKQLDELSDSLNKAMHPAARKIEATAKVLERVEPLPIISGQSPEEPKNPGTTIQAAAHGLPASSPEIDQRSDLMPEIVEEPVEKTMVNMTTVAKKDGSGWPKSRMAEMTTLDNLTEVKGELRIPNTIVDSLLPTLEPAAALVYLRLYRLSYGYRTDTCTVGLQKLALATNTSQKTVQRTIEYLERRQLISRTGVSFGGKMKGNHFKVNIPSMANLTRVKKATLVKTTTGAKLTTVASLTTNKHDDLLNTNHHQRADHPSLSHFAQTVSAYTQITKNPWLETDTTVYKERKIDQVPIGRVKALICTVAERTGARINSFNYFVKELLSSTDAHNKQQQRRDLQRIINMIRELHVGAHNYTTVDFVDDVKRACTREGVVFDNDLFNELCG